MGNKRLKDMTYTHIDQLFCNGERQEVIKDHCVLCHHSMRIAKKVRGNCCVECNDRASRVGRYMMSHAESDLLLALRTVDLENEVWIIDGVSYTKYPNGKLTKNLVLDDFDRNLLIKTITA